MRANLVQALGVRLPALTAAFFEVVHLALVVEGVHSADCQPTIMSLTS